MGEACDGIRCKIDHGAARHIVKQDRQRNRVVDRAEMGLKAFLVGIVVIGANHQRGVSADGLGVLDQFDRLVCRVGPGPGDHGHAAFGNFNTKRYDIFMLLR